jgi:SAM-dependent methyltransferase
LPPLTLVFSVQHSDHPETQVTGTDLSPIQPPFVPPNISFEIDDAEDTWTFRTPFDYIHIRSLAGSISNWPKLLRQCYEHLKPGGWLELQEFEVWIRSDDGSLEMYGKETMRWQTGLNEASEAIGRPMIVAPYLKGWLEDVGFQGVEEVKVKVGEGGCFFSILSNIALLIPP